MLERTAGLVDFLSCHIYFYEDDDLGAFLRSARVLDDFLEKVDGVIRHVKATQPGARDVKISLDEWNVWDHREYGGIASRPAFEVAPRLLEVDYTVADAVVVGSLLQSILAHCDIVSIAAMAQLVNVIGPIRAEPGTPAWRQTIFHPFAAAARSAGHTVLSTRTDAVDGADTVATVTQSAHGAAIEVMLTNRSPERSADVELDLRPLAPDVVESAQLLWDPDVHASNTADDRDRVVPRPISAVLDEGRLRVTLPPVSWAAVRLASRLNGG